jgi:hypothetical protein
MIIFIIFLGIFYYFLRGILKADWSNNEKYEKNSKL